MSPEGLDKKIAKEAGLKAGEIYSAEYPVACGGDEALAKLLS